jgi:hypothetical protein
MGQSNIAAGATLGSNHNSRAADGEMVTGRGFWPGLCVSLKHNSKFATFTLLAKGDYPAELDIRMPFSLVSNDVTNNKLIIMPAYWFMYNLYALARNSAKYAERDKRTKRLQLIEYSFLAPDSINEIFTALDLLRQFTAYASDPAWRREDPAKAIQEGERLLNNPSTDFSTLEIIAPGFECNNRPAQIIKAKEAYNIYKKLVLYYAAEQLSLLAASDGMQSFRDLLEAMPAETSRRAWLNIGGQLLPEESVTNLLHDIKEGTVDGWDGIHRFYQENGRQYPAQKRQHAFASLLELMQIDTKGFTPELFYSLLQEAIEIKTWMFENIYESRAKDYESSFRKMVYDSEQEMNEVMGALDDNSFIRSQKEELESFRNRIQQINKKFGFELP